MTNYLTISRMNGLDGSNAQELTTLETKDVNSPYAIPSITSRLYTYHESLGLKVLGNPMPMTIYGDAPTQKTKGFLVKMPDYFNPDTVVSLRSASITSGSLVPTGNYSEFNSSYAGVNPKRLFISGNTYVASMEDGTLVVDGTVSTEYDFAVELTSGRVLLSGPTKTSILHQGTIQFTKTGTTFLEGFSFRAVITSAGNPEDFFFSRGQLYKITQNNIILLQTVLPDDYYSLIVIPVAESNYIEGLAFPYMVVKSPTQYHELYFDQGAEQFNISGKPTVPNMYINMDSRFTYLSNGAWASAYNDNAYVFVNRVTSTSVGPFNSFTTFDDAKVDVSDRLSGTSDIQRYFFGADTKDTAKLFYIRQGNFKVDTYQFGGLEDIPTLVGASSSSSVPFSTTGLTITDHVSYKMPYATNSGYTQAVVAFFRLSNGAIVGVTGENTSRYFFLPAFCSMPALFKNGNVLTFLYYDARMNTLVEAVEVFAS